MVIIIV